MGLFQRMSDIITANLNEMVERFEDPPTMLKQAIREMEAAIAATLDRAVEVIATQKLLEKQLDDERRQAEHWLASARRAVADDDDTRARQALVRRAEHQKLQTALEQERLAAEQLGRRLRCQIAAMQAKLAEARRKVTTLSARQQLAVSRRSSNGTGHCGARGSALSGFEHWAGRVERAEAEAEAYEELTASLWPEETADSLDVDIEEELRILKQL